MDDHDRIHKYLHDALQAVDDILEFVNGIEFRDYDTNLQLQAAVERKFEIIGEP